VPFFPGGNEPRCLYVHSFPPAELLHVRAEDNLILSGYVDANAVIRERLRVVEVENEKQPSTFESNDLVTAMLERNEGLKGLSFNHVSVVEWFILTGPALNQPYVPSRLFIALSNSLRYL
jgi:hypothetical protein